MKKAWGYWSVTLSVLALAITACGAPAPEADNPPGPESTGAGEEQGGPVPTVATPTGQSETWEGTPLPPGHTGPYDEPRAHEHPTPPPATITVNGTSQTAGLGTYCWSAEGLGLCVDKIGVPTPREPLVTSSPISATFDVTQDPVAISMSVVPAKPQYEVEGHGDDWRWWQTGEPLLTEDLAPGSPRIELVLDPGTYIVSLFVRWQERGDATYGFLVRAE